MEVRNKCKRSLRCTVWGGSVGGAGFMRKTLQGVKVMEGAWLGPGSCVPGRSEPGRAGSEGMEPEGLSENDTLHMLVT